VPVVEAKDLCFTYHPEFSLRRVLGLAESGRGVEALRGVTFRVEPGEVYGVLGPNGAGKTTLLKTLATILVPASGELRMFGLDPERDGESVRSRLGVSLGEFERTFQFRLSGRKNLEFHSAFLGIPRREARARAEEVIATVGLTAAAEKMFLEYSTGMKQRLALARALLNRPQLLVLDEPTAGLDVASSRALGDVVRRLASEGAAILYSTHRLEEAGRLCDRILVLKEGRALTEATPTQIRRLHQDTQVLSLRVPKARPEVVGDLRALPFVKACIEDGESVRLHLDSISERFYAVVAVLEKHGVAVEGVRSEEPDLADAFLRLTGGAAA